LGTILCSYYADSCKAIAAGGFHSLAIQDDYTVVAWGAGIYDFTNTDGTLDYNTYLLWGQSKVPTDGVDLNNVPIPLKAQAIAAGYAHSVALKFDGTVVAWGAGIRYKAEGGYSHMEYGQAIAPLGTYTKIAAGYAHNLAIDALSNFVVAWGWNDYGQCGFADEEVIHNYLWVKPCLGLVSKISAGSIHSLAIRNFSAITSVTPSSGSIAGGTIITISGTNLASNLCLPTVMIGTTPATNVSVSSGVITATTPTAPNGIAGPQNVVVSNPYFSVVAINGFEYTATLTSLTSVSPLIGPTTGGTTFTIRGSHLENISGVSIGGARATIVSQTPTKIMAKTPGGNVGPSNIVVTSSTGSLTNPSVFIYTSGGGSVPTIALLEPSSGATSGGTVITIRGTGFFSTSGVSFGGIDTTFNVLSDTVITAISPPGTNGIENVVVTTLLGESCTAEEAFTYTSCASDLDGSGVVDSGDVGMVLLDTGECQGCPTDLDGSGFVDSGDVGMVLLDSGPCQ
jgi:IPT/TIG domain